MPTIYRKEASRVSLAEAKQLIIELLPVETTGEIFAHFTSEGEIDLDAPISVIEAVGKPHVQYMTSAFKNLCAELEIKPTMRWRPDIKGYPDSTLMDGEYTISHDEFSKLASRYDIAVSVGEAEHHTNPLIATPLTSPPAPAIAVEQKEVTGKTAATGPRLSITRAALIAQHKHEWPTIERDLKDAGENGLSNDAKAGQRDWYEDAAMQWARSKNKLIQPANPASLSGVMSNFTSRVNRLKG